MKFQMLKYHLNQIHMMNSICQRKSMLRYLRVDTKEDGMEIMN